MSLFKKPQPESLIKRDVVQYLELCPEWFGFTVTNSGIYDPSTGKFRRRIGAGMKLGVSDLIGSWAGQFCAIEVKTKTGRLSDHQRQFISDVIRAGGIAFVVKSLDDIIEWVAALREVQRDNYEIFNQQTKVLLTAKDL